MTETDTPEPIRKPIRRAAVFLISGMVLILLTHLARACRPGRLHPSFSFILGVLPNFAAAFSLPFLSIAAEALFPKLRLRFSNRSSRFLFAVCSVVAALVFWEFIQKWAWKIPFDFNDILATLAGGLLSLPACGVFRREIPPEKSGRIPG
jgi:hypothetical protein